MSAPVVVAGNGPVGQSAALLLSRWEIPVILLDRRAAREPVGSKSICQQGDVLDIWESVGAGQRIADEGVTWTTARTFYRDTELFSHTLGAGTTRFPPFVNISQSRTEEILDQRIAAQPRIDVRWDREVTGLSEHDHGITAVAGGERIEASYVVACTGARSTVIRDLLGIPFEGHSFDDKFLICDIRTEMPGWAMERRFFFDPRWNPGRQVLIHPCPGSSFRIDWQVPESYALEEDESSGGLDARIRAIVGDRPYDLLWRTVYRFQSRVAERMGAGRVLLAGDCAHLFAPFGARGLNSGVADAENLAWKVAFTLRGWAGPRLLATYHDERRAAALENLEITAATMDFLVPQDERARRRRHDLLSSAVSDPSARALVDSGRLAEPYWYPQSPLTTAGLDRPPATRPPRGAAPPPGPGVIVPDVPIWDGTARLRAISRDGILLLAERDSDVASLARTANRITDAPVRADGMGALGIAGALGARPGEVWIVRPDAHVAEVLPDAAETGLAAALGRLLG